jgi:hypothetical protein
MLDILQRVENALLPMLENRSAWSSLNINYHRPFVERLWLPMKVDDQSVRVNLHLIQPCNPQDVLFHPHPWPAAMRILRGTYEMGVGVGKYGAPDVSMRIVGQRGTAYEMTDPNAWHYVRPLDMSNVLSLMVTGTPWPEEIVQSNPSPPKGRLGELREDRVTHILNLFKLFYKSRQMAMDPSATASA